jgi:hypothetical protein
MCRRLRRRATKKAEKMEKVQDLRAAVLRTRKNLDEGHTVVGEDIRVMIAFLLKAYPSLQSANVVYSLPPDGAPK